MTQATLRRNALPISILSIVIILFAVITAVIHLDRAIMMGFFGGHAGGPPAGHAGGPSGGGHFASRGPSGPMSAIFQQLPLLFFLNFVGYIVLVVALYLPQLKKFQSIIRWLLIAFAAVTIIAYFAIAGFHTNITAYADKVIEVALIILLLIESRNAASRAKG